MVEFQDAVKQLRQELALTQSELAAALHITPLTVGRWERGRNRPNNAAVSLLMGYARVKGASNGCLDALRKSTSAASNRGIKISSAGRSPVEQLADDAFCPIYVCDFESYALLYLNRAAERLFHIDGGGAVNKLCYACFMHREKPCAHCCKDEVADGSYAVSEAFEAGDGSQYRLRTKTMNWNGRKARVCYVLETAVRPG